MIRRFLVALFLLTLLPACSSQPAAPTPQRMLEVKASIDTLWTRYAFASDAHDAGGFALLFVEDALLMLPDLPTKRGIPEIQECLGALYTGMDATALRIDNQYLSVAGSNAFQCGGFEEDFTSGGVARTRYGRFAMALEEGKNREWRIRSLTVLADSVR